MLNIMSLSAFILSQEIHCCENISRNCIVVSHHLLMVSISEPYSQSLRTRSKKGISTSGFLPPTVMLPNQISCLRSDVHLCVDES